MSRAIRVCKPSSIPCCGKMEPQPKIYLIPGMGADARLFEGLLREGLDFEVLEFIPPLSRETLPDYAQRLARSIDVHQPFIIGGVSLGGVMATEIAHAHAAQGLLLISSVKHAGEFPLYFRLGRYLPLHRLFSGGFLRRHGPRASRKHLPDWQQVILRDLRRDADDAFIEWAIHAVIHWRGRHLHPNCLHIHGTRDFMLPGLFLGRRVSVPGGRHVMVVTHARQIVSIIHRWLKSEQF